MMRQCLSLIKTHAERHSAGAIPTSIREAFEVLRVMQKSLLRNLVFIAGCDKLGGYILVHHAGRTLAHEYRKKAV